MKMPRRQPKRNIELAGKILDKIPWFQTQLITWFDTNRRIFPWRENHRSAYEILIAEILLQRTSASSVANSYPNFIEAYPTWNKLGEVSLDELQQALKPFGLWRQKADILHTLAFQILKRNGQLPQSRLELESLPGVGQYIASAILSILHKKREPLIDVNMARVLERFFGPRRLADIRDDPYLQSLARAVVDSEHSLHLNWAILDFAALVCQSQRPRCLTCPLQTRCIYFINLQQEP